MKRYSLLLLALVLLLSFGSIRSSPVEQVTFYGFVFSSFPVAPIEGAVVSVWTSDALGTIDIGLTDWHGYYEGNSELPPGWYWLQAVYKDRRSKTPGTGGTTGPIRCRWISVSESCVCTNPWSVIERKGTYTRIPSSAWSAVC